MPAAATEEEIAVARKRIRDNIVQARLRFETIINNNLFAEVMNRGKQGGGFPPLRYLEQLFAHIGGELQQNRFCYEVLYQLIELLSYFIYYCKAVMSAEGEADSFLPQQSANIRIQIKLALEMFPRNLAMLCNNTRLLLAYATNLERIANPTPSYKNRLRLFQVEKLLFATRKLTEASDFELVYDNMAANQK